MSDQQDWNKMIIKEFRDNQGRVGGYFENMTLLLLHTRGAKSGKERVNPVAYIKDGDRYVIIASKGGAPTHPDWYHNLVANPDVHVEVGADQFDARATVTKEPERTQLYTRVETLYPGFKEYRENTDRAIPVITLTRST